MKDSDLIIFDEPGDTLKSGRDIAEWNRTSKKLFFDLYNNPRVLEDGDTLIDGYLVEKNKS